MFKTMIIDDDKNIRERLISMIPWKELQLDLVCEADNGDTARELYNLYHPKIIIVDINIPIISGLELAEELLIDDPDIRFIVITGYTDFEYVQKSVRIGAVDLISKPIIQQDICKSLKKAILYFKNQRDLELKNQTTKMLLEENMPILQNQYASLLVTTDLPEQSPLNDQSIIFKLQTLGIDLISKNYSVIVFQPIFSTPQLAEIDLMQFVIKNVTSEMLQIYSFKTFTFYNASNYLISIIGSDSSLISNQIEAAVTKIFDKLKFYFQINLLAGIGTAVYSVEKIPDSYKEALEALYTISSGNGENIIHYKNISVVNPNKSIPLIQHEECINELLRAYKENNLHHAERVINAALASLNPNKIKEQQRIKITAVEMAAVVIKESVKAGADEKTIAKGSQVFASILIHDRINELNYRVIELVKLLIENKMETETEHSNQVIIKAKKYISDNYDQDALNLDAVSDHVGLSKMYFCKLFHKEEGVCFNDYLNSFRINKAKDLLQHSNDKVYEVSYKTGFKNAKYFHYVFKRLVGKTPLEYKNIKR